MAPPIIAALDIGTSQVIALVGELREDGNVMITGMGVHPSKGVRKGEIIDLENSVSCVRAAISDAEESSGNSIRSLHLVVTGGHVQSLINRGTVPVFDPGGEISSDDMDQVVEVASAINLPNDQELLHTVHQHYCIDGQEKVSNPEGMEGAKLSLDLLMVHGQRSVLRNTIKVVQSIPLEVADVGFGGLCSAFAVLSPEQRSAGVIAIDLGGGVTDYVAYSGNALAAAGALGVGGDHVTNDIGQCFTIPRRQAETIKCESGSAIVDVGQEGRRLALPAEVGFQGRSINQQSLQKVINARMTENFEMIRDRLAADGVLNLIGAGVVLTGGGAHMKGVVQLAEDVFRLPCHVGRPRSVSGLAVATEGPEYAAAIGMVQYAFRTLDSSRRNSVGTWFKGLLGFN